MAAADEITDAPPAGEEVHLPGPSLVPPLNAAGFAMILIGLTISWYISGIGALIFLSTLVRWIRDTARDIDELPAEHGHH